MALDGQLTIIKPITIIYMAKETKKQDYVSTFEKAQKFLLFTKGA